MRKSYKDRRSVIKLFDKSKLVKNLAQDTILVPYLEREFERFDEPWEFKYTTKERDQGWHPSGDCLPLASALYEKAQATTVESHSGSLRKSFMVGHFWHQWIQHIVLHKLEFCAANAIEKHRKAVWTYEEGEFHSNHPKPFHYVSGTGDFAPLVTPRWQGVVDIKTMSGSDFAKGKVPARFADKYKCQINIYMDLFDLDEAMILAVNKDSPHSFLEFRYTRDQPLIDAIKNKWEFVSYCLDHNDGPDPSQDDEYGLPL